MSDADLLLDAIWANPDDDTPRLVYADWLQENGHEKYAHFIRFSCRMLHLPHEEKQLFVDELYRAWRSFRRTMPLSVSERFEDLNHFHRGIAQGAGLYAVLTPRQFLNESASWWPVPAPSMLALTYKGDDPLIGHSPYLCHVREIATAKFIGRPWREAPQDDAFLLDLAGSTKLLRLKKLDVGVVRARAATVERLLDAPFLTSIRELSIDFQLTNGDIAHLKCSVPPDDPGPGSELRRREIKEFLATFRHQLPALDGDGR